MTVAFMNLVVAESSAESLIGMIDVGGNLSSAFQLRHKVRATDVSALLTLCAGTAPHSYARLIAVAYLMCYASAAYPQVMEMVASPGPNLATLPVSQHFDPTSWRALRTACVEEPMNLWYGWTLENQRNNSTTFDPHLANYFLNNNGQVLSVSMPSSPPAVAPVGQTDGQRIAAAAFPAGTTIQGAGAPPGFPPAFVRTTTPTSTALQAMLASDVQSRNAFSQIAAAGQLSRLGTPISLAGETVLLQKLSLYYSFVAQYHQLPHNDLQLRNELEVARNGVLTSLGNMWTLVNATTAAGELHYNNLINQLALRNPGGMGPVVQGMSNTIAVSLQQWSANRAILMQRLTTTINSLAAKASNPWAPNFYCLQNQVP
jgi:hypothetical protein